MEIVLQIILLIIIAIILKDVKLGVALYLFYSIVVPYCKLSIGSFSLQQNFINIIALFVILYKVPQIDVKPFYALFTFYTLFLLVMPLCSGVGFSYQLEKWRSGLMIALCIPIAIWNMHSLGKDPYYFCRNLVIAAIIISCVYGVILTQSHGINPYIMFFNDLRGGNYSVDWFAAESRLFGRISSVFDHPMRFGMFLGCSLIYLYSIRDKINTVLLYVLLLLVTVNVVTCGIRSVLAASLMTIAYFLLISRKFKFFIVSAIITVIIFAIINSVPAIEQYFTNVMDVSEKSDIGGSSLEMRLDQLQGCFHEIRDCQFFGKGYMWHENILEVKGAHPVIKGFESLVFIILCDHGYFGFFVYALMTCMLLLMQKKYIKNSDNRIVLTCFIIFYYSYTFITGDYQYFKILLIFYFLTFSEMYISQTKFYNERTNILDRLFKRTTSVAHM